MTSIIFCRRIWIMGSLFLLINLFSLRVIAQEEPDDTTPPPEKSVETPSPVVIIPPSPPPEGEEKYIYQGLRTLKKSLQVGGELTVNTTSTFYYKSQVLPNSTGVLLKLSPTLGFFLFDHFELQGVLRFQKGFGDQYAKVPMELGLNAGFRYLFDLRGRVYPFLGLRGGVNFLLPNENSFVIPGLQGTATFFVFNAPMGILIAINDHLAVNLGLEPEVSVGINVNSGIFLTIPVGVFGIEGFF